MKIQITEQDIKTMTEACVKRFLREWYGDPCEKIDLKSALYNPTTNEVYFVTSYGANLEDEVRRANLGNGWIWYVSFRASSCDYEDTSFDYDTGMGSETQKEGGYYPSEVSIVDEYPIFFVQDGEIVDSGEDGPEELEPDQREFILSYANDNLELLQTD